jgi:hypothetical protein
MACIIDETIQFTKPTINHGEVLCALVGTISDSGIDGCRKIVLPNPPRPR